MKRKHPIRRAILLSLAYLLGTVCLAVVSYALFSLFFNTSAEERLSSEISMYERIYPSLEEKERLLRESIAYLQHKDERIYSEVFHSEAPSAQTPTLVRPGSDLLDTPQASLQVRSSQKADSLIALCQSVEERFQSIFDTLSDSLWTSPPLRLPLKGINYSQVGASIGKKLDPSYGAYVYHEGLDMIVQRGTPVYATARGTVLSVSNTKRNGRMVEISHQGGYTTVFSHLESVSVKAGQTVSPMTVIGTSGMSGKSYAPHLHYEIRYNGRLLDPVHYFFADLGPMEYTDMFYMALNTKQSMD